MKLLLVLCFIAPLAVFAHVVENDVDAVDAVNFIVDYGHDKITDDQKKCIHDSVKKIMDENTDLKWWFDEVHEAAMKMRERAEECKKKDNETEKKVCFTKLKIMAKMEYMRLMKKLPANKKDVVEKIKDAVKECMKTV